MRTTLPLLAALALAAAPAAAAQPPAGLNADCVRVHKVYPTLMLARMMEGPMNCGTSDDGSVYVDCAAGETPEQKAAHARRFATRSYQEHAYKKADEACDAYEKDRKSPGLRDAAAAAIAEARATDHGLPPQGAGAAGEAPASAPASRPE